MKVPLFLINVLRASLARAPSVPTLVMAIGLLRLLRSFIWISVARSQFRLPVERNTSTVFLTTNPTLALFLVLNIKVMLFSTFKLLRRSWSVHTASRSCRFVVVVNWNLQLDGWVCIWLQRALFFRKRFLMLTNRTARVNVIFVLSRKVDRPYWPTLVCQCLSGLMLFSLVNIFVIVSQLRLCLMM